MLRQEVELAIKKPGIESASKDRFSCTWALFLEFRVYGFRSLRCRVWVHTTETHVQEMQDETETGLMCGIT